MNSREEIKTIGAPRALGAYAQGVRFGNFVFLSGQLPLNTKNMQLIEGDFKSQVLQVFSNLEALAEAAESTMADLIKLTVYLTNLENFHVVNEVMSEVLVPPYPARTTVGVNALPKGAEIEIDAILWSPTKSSYNS